MASKTNMATNPMDRNLEPNFKWNWQGVLSTAAQEGMDGYNRAASNAARQMEGYSPTAVVDAGTQGGAVYRGIPGVYAEQAAAQEAQRAEQIRALESQIAEIEARIAQNLQKLRNFTGSMNQIAALEAQKFNSSDPTMIWRWQQQREDALNSNDALKSNSANKFVNEVEALTKTSISPDYAEQVQQLRNIRNKIAEGKTLGYDVSGLEEMERLIQDKVDDTYGNIEAVKTIRNKLKNLDQQAADKTISPEEYTAALNTLMSEDFEDDELRRELNTKYMHGSKKAVEASQDAAKKEFRRSIFGD